MKPPRFDSLRPPDQFLFVEGRLRVAPPCTGSPFLEETPLNPLSVKGAGEGGSAGCGAVLANAVADALAPLGVPTTALPLSPDRLHHLIKEHRPRDPQRNMQH